MPTTLDVLTSLVDTMGALTTPKPGGFAVDGTVVPKPGQIDVTEIIKGALDLTFLTKDVRFSDAKLEPDLTAVGLDPKILGGLPLGGVTTLPGVGGLLGQVTGSLPLLDKARLSVSIEVTWTVLDAEGRPLATDQWSVSKGTVVNDGGVTKIRGTDITVAFLPAVEELTSNNPVPAPVIRTLRAHVKLSAGGTTVERDLPDIPVPVPTLAIPKVLAAFLHVNFQARDGDDDGGVLVMVPGNSPLRSVEQLSTTLSALQAAVTTVKSFAGFATFLLGLDELIGALAASPYFAFAATDAIDDLNDITIIQRSWYENDTELEDELSSMIFIGPAGKVLDVFCETDFDDENGHCKVTVGPDHVTLIRSLHSDHPASEPGGMVQVLVEPTHVLIDDDDLTFGDWTSSLRFL
jgi:hypothetical protein